MLRLKRRVVRAIALGLAGAVLMAQAALAGYACPSMSGAIADDAGFTSEAAAQVRGGDAFDMTDPAAPGVCAEHCKVGQQSNLVANLALPASVMAELYTAPPARATASVSPRAADWLTAIIAASPPHAILHCVRRT